jgi:hypothetical protein
MNLTFINWDGTVDPFHFFWSPEAGRKSILCSADRRNKQLFGSPG